MAIPHVSIVIPTRNEMKNVRSLLEEIRFTLKGICYEVIFVDDSNDATPRVIEEEKKKDDRIRLIHREKHLRSGLATAVVAGIERAQGEYFCCLDADLQHPPRVIPLLLRTIVGAGADVVVASRYMRGGSAAGLGSRYRRLASLAGKYAAYLLLPRSRCSTDPGSGFFIIHNSVVRSAVLRPIGPKILLEIFMRARFLRVCDVPYVFRPRYDGTSKSTVRQGFAYVRHVWRLCLLEAGNTRRLCRGDERRGDEAPEGATITKKTAGYRPRIPRG